MSQWDERFTTHPALALFQELKGLVDGLSPVEPATLEASARLQKVVSLVLSTFNEVDAELVSQAMLDGVHSPATNMAAELREFASDSAATRLDTANTYADQILDAVSGWPVPRSAGDIDGLRERASSYRASVGQLLRRVEEEIGQVRTEVSDVRTSLDTIRTEAGTSVESIQRDGVSKIEEANTKVAELAATTEMQKARLDQAIATFQQQFSEAEATRAQRFETAAKDQQTETTELIRSLKEQAETGLGQFIESGEETLADLRKKEGEARTLAVSLGAIGVSGGHGQYAKEQKKSADFWRWVSVLSLLTLVGLALVILATLPEGGIEWERFSAKLLISGPLIALAGYAANQSAKHRRAEREARKVDLDLAALELYLALFPAEKRDEIKEQIGLKVFGQPLAPDGKVDERIGAGQLWDFINRTIQPK